VEPESLRAVLRRLPPALAILLVLGAYAFFASGGTFTFRRLPSYEKSMYASLLEGFRHGHTYLPQKVDPKMAALPFPYDMKARDDAGVFYIWDASYLNGRYYLYFSPLPAFLFYLPFRIVRHAYPHDRLAGAFFAAWGFLGAVAFAWRALKMWGGRRRIPLTLWILFIGFGNVACFLLTDIRIYEIAVMAGMAMTSMWAYALLRFAVSPTPRRALLVGLWLALAIAARPNLGVLLFVTAALLWRLTPKNRRLFLWTLAPLAVVAVAMLAYNFARFHNPFEFGVQYQLTMVPMAGRSVCSLCTLPELSRFFDNLMHYVFWPPVVRTYFPFIKLQMTSLDPTVSFPMGRPEEAAGVFAIAPLTMLGTFFAALFALRRERPAMPTRVASHVMAGAWLVVAGLSTCWWVVSRYDLDFMLLMTASSVVLIEDGLAFLDGVGVRLLPLRIAIWLLALWSIAGFLTGFMGPQDAFQRMYPAMFAKIVNHLK
jgi:hypothetical protein